jgi:hypothetical protein
MSQSSHRSAGRLAALALLAGALVGACGSASSHSSSATTGGGAAPATAVAAPTSASPATTARPATPATATAAAPTTSVTAAAAGGAVTTGGGGCYVGHWTSTSYTQLVQGQHIAGGAGIHFTITPSEMSINFAGMQPVTITGTISGQGIFSGQEQASASFSQAGTFALPVKGTSNVTFAAKLGGQSSYSPPIKAGGFPTGGITGTYTCSSSALALTVPTPQGPTTVTLARG